MKQPVPIAGVSDTARWVAMYRAMESERPDALFHDPFARRLAGAQGEEILRTLPKARQFAWPMIVRTAVMDEIILRTIRQDGADAVLNLAAGLDARPYRLDLPATLRWIEADFPVMIDHKETQLAGEQPRCRLERERVDLTDAAARDDLLRRVGGSAERVLVVTEGLLVYLEPEQVAALARALGAAPAFRWWLTDLAMPRILAMMNRHWGKQMTSSPFRFAPAEGTAWFTPHGWQEREFRSNWDESFRLNRTMRMGRFWRFVGSLFPRRKRQEMTRMAGVVLFERRER